MNVNAVFRTWSKKGRSRAARPRQGAAMIELAFVLPVFLMLVFGILEVGRIVMVSQMVTEASRVACRLAVLTGVTATDVTNEATTFLTAGGIPASAVTVTITGQTVAGGAINQTIKLATIQEGLAVCVRVQVNYAQAAWIPPTRFAVPTISASTVMRKESH